MKRLAAFCITVLIVGPGGWLVSSLSDASGLHVRKRVEGSHFGRPDNFIAECFGGFTPTKHEISSACQRRNFQVEYVLLVVRGACAQPKQSARSCR